MGVPLLRGRVGGDSLLSPRIPNISHTPLFLSKGKVHPNSPIKHTQFLSGNTLVDLPNATNLSLGIPDISSKSSLLSSPNCS